MKISTVTAELAGCLETAEKALPVRTTIPATANIHLAINSDKLVFSATNHEIMIKVSMGYQGSESGAILLPPKIVDIVRYFPTPDINVDINWDNFRLDITGGSARFHLYGSAADDFPISSLSKNDQSYDSFDLELNNFKKLLKEVVFAASNEETRPAFNGILFSFKDDILTLTASDTYRLVVKKISDPSWSFYERKCLVPAKALREFLRIAGDGHTAVNVVYHESLLSMQFANILFASRLLEEKYPDVSGVIPREYKTRVVINRKMLEDTVSRAALFAEGKNQAINIIVGNEKLEVRVHSQEGSMEELLPANQDGEEIDIYVNSRFVLDILKVLDCEEIMIDFHGEEGPIVFRMVDDQGYLYLVLPIKKNS